jgi:ABC-type dipeptide/oligopeptide/nickel transport system permease subunit
LREKSQLLHRLKKSKFFIIGLILASLLILMAILAPYIITYEPGKTSLRESLVSPRYLSEGWSGHIFGTDNLGRDILSRLLIGSRYSFVISLSSVLLAILLGIIAGLYSGYYGGWIDNVIMRFADTQLSIPQLLLAIAIVAVLGPSIINLILVLAITTWPQIGRLVRGNVLIVREMEFIKASRVLGAGDMWIIFTQVLPNITTPLFIVASQRIGFMILLEASLSFLGLGVQPPTPSWGGMISDGRQFLMTAPWIIITPGIALMLAVLAFNFIGDGLRDALDPRMKT